jgi:hypothetical protein
MLRLIVLLCPPATGIEFHAYDVTNLPPDPVGYLARQLAAWVRNPQRSFHRDRQVDEQAGAKPRNIVQVGRRAAGPAGLLVLPANVHYISTKHPRFNTPVEHAVGYRQGLGNALALMCRRGEERLGALALGRSRSFYQRFALVEMRCGRH